MSFKPLQLYKNYKEACEKFPNCSILVDKETSAFPELGTQTTDKETHEVIVKRARQLATLGVKQGDKVLLYKSSSVDTYWLAVSVCYLGAVPVMTSFHLSSEVIEIFSERLEKPWILFDDVTTERIIPLPEEVKQRAFSVSDVLHADETYVDFNPLPDTEISYMTHTSGTTGVPKLIAHSAINMGWRIAFQQRSMENMDRVDLLAFHISPVHSRFNIGMSSLMNLGYPYFYISDSSVQNVEKVLQHHSPIAIETHPNNFVQWAHLAKEKPHLFENTRYYHSTFDAINKETMATFLRTNKESNGIYLQIYGQSECGPAIVRKHTLESLPTTDVCNMGVSYLDFTKARIANEQGTPLPANAPGNIHLFSKGRAVTYYKEEDRFNANVYGDWWDTGDYGYMNEAGELILQDRQVDLVESLPSTLSIEDFLLDTHDWIEEIVIVKDPNGYPQPVVAVKDDGEFLWDAWWKTLVNLPHLNEPIILKFDAFPRTATMKVQRRALEQQLFQ